MEIKEFINDWKNKGDEEGAHAADNACSNADGGIQHGICAYAEEGDDLIQDLFPVQACFQFFQIQNQFRVVCKKVFYFFQQNRYFFG